jgi:putative membrane protein
MNPIKILVHLVVNVIAVAIAAKLLHGVAFDSFTALVLFTVVLGIINTLIRPIVTLLTLPINILTLGIFGLVLNALFVMAAAQLVSGFHIASFWWALAFSVVLSLVSGFLHLIEGKK